MKRLTPPVLVESYLLSTLLKALIKAEVFPPKALTKNKASFPKVMIRSRAYSLTVLTQSEASPQTHLRILKHAHHEHSH